VSPLYAALLGKTYGLALVESPQDGYPAPHINKYSDVNVFDPSNPKHLQLQQYVFTYTERFGELDDDNEPIQHKFLFSYDNSGEHLGYDLPMNLAWGRSVSEYMKSTRSFMFTPFGNEELR
jgi:hypothetical protein